MRHILILAALLPLSAPALADPALKSLEVQLPQSPTTFPGGDKAEAINNNCLTCHSTEMVLTQPMLSKDEWGKEVAKMKKVYGAPVQEQDVAAIVDYLAALKPTN